MGENTLWEGCSMYTAAEGIAKVYARLCYMDPWLVSAHRVLLNYQGYRY